MTADLIAFSGNRKVFHSVPSADAALAITQTTNGGSAMSSILDRALLRVA